MEFIDEVILLIAGVCIFMFGMQMASDNLQKLAADRVRDLMGKVAQKRWLGILSGVGLAAVLQSSSAVTVLLVGLANAGVVTIRQVMSVIIGVAVGTTITVQLISFSITKYALYFLIAGFIVWFSAKTKRNKFIGGIVFGFGLLFFGLMEMGIAVEAIKAQPWLHDVFVFLSSHQYITLIFTTFFTACVHSSAVVIGLAMTLTQSHLISLSDSMWWIYGANIGTTATAILASMSGNYMGKQVAWAHFYYKLLSVVPFAIFTEYYARIIDATGGPLNRQVANAHTIFNIAAGFIFYPVIDQGAAFVEKMFPRPDSDKEFSARYLDETALSTPALAFAHAQREVLRMADYVLDMVRRSVRVFEKCNDEMIEELRQIDNKVDILNQQIKTYLVKLTSESLTVEQSQKVVALITLVSDLENVGDVIDKNLLWAAQKKNRLKLTFSDEGWADIKEFHRLVTEDFQLAISAFQLNDLTLSNQVITNKRRLRDLEQSLREKHIDRLHRGLQESMNTSSIHLDVLSHYRRVTGYAANFAYLVMRDHGAFPEGRKQSQEILAQVEDQKPLIEAPAESDLVEAPEAALAKKIKGH